MVFSTPIFVFGFLPVFIAVYFLVPRRWKNVWALVGSFFFYAWGESIFALVLVASAAADYWISHRLAASAGRARLAWLWASLLCNFSLLVYFKYANFAVENVAWLVPPMEAWAKGWQHVALPIGISFFTFQKVSYVVDVYRGTVAVSRKFTDFCLYVMLFPQLIAGPIVRYHDVVEQLDHRTHSVDGFLHGLSRFCLGLAKKVLLANQLAVIADGLLDQPYGTLSTGMAWYALTAYTFQILFDFSGYSDMAIGLGKMMGFQFLENFNRPYTARTVTEFWRRWHISLSNWIIEYLYTPLGGSRVPTWRKYMNLWIVFLFTGFWHGADWTFVTWGLYHGLFLTLERLIGRKRLEKIPALIAVPLTFAIVVVGRAFFRMPTIESAWELLKRMFVWHATSSPPMGVSLSEYLTNRGAFIFILAGLISLWPWWHTPAKREIVDKTRYPGHWVMAASLLLALLSMANLMSSGYNPFIYFRF